MVGSVFVGLVSFLGFIGNSILVVILIVERREVIVLSFEDVGM